MYPGLRPTHSPRKRTLSRVGSPCIIFFYLIISLVFCDLVRAETEFPYPIYFKVKDGRMAVDRERTSKEIAADYNTKAKAWGYPSGNALLDVIYQDLDDQLANSVPMIYWYGKPKNGIAHDADASRLLHFNGSWEAFATTYDQWENRPVKEKPFTKRLITYVALFPPEPIKKTNDDDSSDNDSNTNTPPPPPNDQGATTDASAFQKGLEKITVEKTAEKITPVSLILFNTKLTSDYQARFQQTGQLTFQAVPPIRAVKIIIEGNKGYAVDTDLEKRAETFINSFKNELWRPGMLKSRIEAFFAREGYQLADENITIPATVPTEPTPISVSLPRLVNIDFVNIAPGEQLIRAARPLLTTEEYHLLQNYQKHDQEVTNAGHPEARYVKAPDTPAKPSPADTTPAGNPMGSTLWHIDITALRAGLKDTQGGNLAPYPIIDEIRQVKVVQALNSLKYQMVVVPISAPSVQPEGAPQANLQEIVIIKPDDAPSTQEQQDKAGKKGGTTTTTPSSGNEDTSELKVKEAPAKWSYTGPPFSLAGSVEYLPYQGTRESVDFKTTLTKYGAGTVGLKGGYFGKPFGNLSYTDGLALGDNMFTSTINALSDYAPKRILDGTQTDVRSSGGNVTVTSNIFVNNEGQALDLGLGFNQQNIGLSQAVPGQASGTNQSILNLNANYLWRFHEANPTEFFRVNGQFNQGFNDSASQVYEGGTVGTTFRFWLSDALTYENDSLAQLASGATPLSLKPSLGGATTVRGFRQDSGFGNYAFSTQNELWWPVPGIAEDKSLRQDTFSFFYEHIRLGTFFDTGYVVDSINRNPGVLLSPGAGVRLDAGVAAVKLDVAYGFATSGVKGGLQFTVGISSQY